VKGHAISDEGTRKWLENLPGVELVEHTELTQGFGGPVPPAGQKESWAAMRWLDLEAAARCVEDGAKSSNERPPDFRGTTGKSPR
jgi:hypothetical protein